MSRESACVELERAIGVVGIASRFARMQYALIYLCRYNVCTYAREEKHIVIVIIRLVYLSLSFTQEDIGELYKAMN